MEKSYVRGSEFGQFNGERIVLLRRWPVMEENDR